MLIVKILTSHGLTAEALYHFSVLKRDRLRPEGIENERMFVFNSERLFVEISHKGVFLSTRPH